MINFRMSFRRSPRLKNLVSKLTNRFLSSFEMTLLIILFLTATSLSQDKNKIDFENCSFNGFPLYGKVKFVDSFPDIKIKIVDSFPDIKIKFVESFPGKP